MLYFDSIVQKQKANTFNLLFCFGLVGLCYVSITLVKVCTVKYRISLNYKIIMVIDNFRKK